MRSGQLLSLGSINVDVQMRVDGTPPAGETSFGRDFAVFSGGKAANAAYMARRLGTDAALIGAIGQDELANRVLEPLAAEGVNLEGVRKLFDTPTGLAIVLVDADGEKTIVQAPNANLVWDSKAIEAMRQTIAAAPDHSVLLVDLEVSSEAAQAAADAAHARDIPVILDPSPATRASALLLQSVDFVTPNAAEAERLTGMPVTGHDDAIAVGKAFIEAGVMGAALIKLRTGGCAVVSRDDAFTLPAIPVESVDKTGAGDAFAGAFGVAIIEGMSLREAARFALAAANLSVAGYGAQSSYPTRAEIERELEVQSAVSEMA
jgi:ribokinase